MEEDVFMQRTNGRNIPSIPTQQSDPPQKKAFCEASLTLYADINPTAALSGLAVDFQFMEPFDTTDGGDFLIARMIYLNFKMLCWRRWRKRTEC